MANTVSQSIRTFWGWLVRKDTGDECQSGNDGDTQSCSTHTNGGAERIGSVWDDGLQDGVSDTRHKEQQSSHTMCYGHCRFLKSASRKNMTLSVALQFHFIPFYFIKTCNPCEHSPGRLQQCTCPNRRSSPAPVRLCSGAGSKSLFAHIASPQTCTWRT